MSIKMICSDIDGTLLQYGRQKLEGEIFDRIRALHDLSLIHISRYCTCWRLPRRQAAPLI